MATLSRPKVMPRAQTGPLLASGVPTPFPVEQLQVDPVIASEETEETEETVVTSSQNHEPTPERRADSGLRDVMPSITTLQKSCIMTLNNLLSGSEQWKSIIPDRRHSMPSSPGTSAIEERDADYPSSALQTLVSNLRIREGDDEMTEIRPDSHLLFELRERIQHLSATLAPKDAALANSLVTLLSYFDRLSMTSSDGNLPPSGTPSRFSDAPPPIDMFDALTRQLSDLQFERLTTQSTSSTTSHLETDILWSHIDRELESVVTLCKARTEGLPRFYQENLPPQYDYDFEDVYDFESLPEYDGAGRPSIEGSKSEKFLQGQASSSTRASEEKMRLDLEAVAMAIDRLYLVAPQLHNQRVELKSSKLAQLEKARKEGVAASSRKGKERDVKELDNIFEMLGKASERTLKDQTVVLDRGIQSKLEKARMKDIANRDAFVEELIKHSDAGRMHGQDAILQPKVKDPQAMLTLPEFIREAIPLDSELLHDPSVMLSLPEFVAQAPPAHIDDVSSNSHREKRKKSNRHRSLSAPPLSWLRHSSRSNSSHGSATPSQKSKVHESTFDIVYVAENHENLQHILVFFTVTGQTPGIDLTAEVLPPFPEHHSEGGDHLIIRSGPLCSLPLMLPGRTIPGRKEIRVQNGHFEIKLATIPRSIPAEDSEGISSPLLDATQLSAASPTSFICASCSLPLILPSKPTTYRDLPSEHWEELVEAWMCHTDQKLHDQVMTHGKAGFWPLPDQAFVGGSYILFEGSAISKSNLLPAQVSNIHENWRISRCLCGAVIGRSQERPSSNSSGSSSTCFRVLKYAIRPVTSPSTDLLRIPLSAFIIEDMMEFVQAHASYRFVIRDEEEERPRILVWLFKPRIRLAYTTPRSRAIPKNASITAAKVLYQLIGPSDAKTDLKSILNRYPAFPQAEYLSYPMAICRRLAGLLKESNTAYPESLQVMTGLEVGWLHRR